MYKNCSFMSMPQTMIIGLLILKSFSRNSATGSFSAGNILPEKGFSAPFPAKKPQNFRHFFGGFTGLNNLNHHLIYFKIHNKDYKETNS